MKRVIIILASAILLASCTFSEELSPDEVLKVSNTTFEFDKSANSQTLEIESYCSWDLKCDASWVTFSVTKSGEGKVKNTLSVIENESPVVRSAVAEIYNEDYGVSVKINITQGASAPYIECSRDTIRVSYISQIEKIEVESNIPWVASFDVDWIEISPKSGLSGVTTITINVNKNTSVESRSAVIRIVNAEYEIEEEILVVQSRVPELRVNPEKLENISSDGSTEEIEIESDVSWEASVDVDWISISPKSGLSGVTTMTINVNKNTSVESRSAVIRIVNSEYDIEEEILVVQDEFVPELKVNSENLENISYNGSIGKIEVESNIPWVASFDVDWIEISPKSGLSGVTTITINVNKNTSVESRSAVIRIVNAEYDIEEEILVVQSRVPELKVNPEKLENISSDGSTEEIEIVSNISWEASVDVDWIEISPKSGASGVTTMTINVNKNTSVDSRSSVIKIVNSEYDIEQEILVVQSEFVPELKVNVEKLEDISFDGSTEEIEIASNISWESSIDVDWISISPKSGISGVTTMAINVNKNTSVESRSSVIKIVNSEYDIEQEILVVQSEFVPELKVNVEKLENISFDGSTKEIKIASNISWEASIDVDWIEITPKSGLSGVTAMTINVNKNTSVESRSAVIRIVNSEYNMEQEILVVQSEFVPELKVNREKLENISVEDSSEEIRIESNISWEASIDVNWISISPKSGISGVTTMTINVNKNTSVESRSSVIKIVNSEYDIEQEILVVQSGFVPELKVDREKLENISVEGSSEEIRIESNISWEASIDVNWISISPKSGLSGVTTMTINVNKNASVESRSAVIRIVNSEYEIEEEILVVQSEFVPELKVNVEKLENISYNGSIEEIRMESNISWKASVDVDWIEISPKSGASGVTTMTIDVNKNTSVASRSAVIRIVNSEYEIEEEILVVQSEFVPELKVNVEKLENISYNGSIEEIRIESNISWEASVDVNWISISPKSGVSGVSLMSVSVGENVLEESRDGIITLKNEEYSLTVYVNIQQNKWEPKINGHEYVDLGLPSGLKWATCNVGASSSEEYGDYYAWGEIETKDMYYDSETYGKSMSDISGNSMYDVARAKWGSSWRLPTEKELEELKNNCKWEWTTQNGKKGCKVTGPNGNSIFLPAAGNRCFSSLDYAGLCGYYWSSTPYESDDYDAYTLYFSSTRHGVTRHHRYRGQSVRPVSE